eukprot:2215960-Rhodomonas_salina.1
MAATRAKNSSDAMLVSLAVRPLEVQRQQSVTRHSTATENGDNASINGKRVAMHGYPASINGGIAAIYSSVAAINAGRPGRRPPR